MQPFLQHMIDSFESTEFVGYEPDLPIFRIEVSIDPLNILDWLAKIDCPNKFYFAARDSSFKAAALGSVHTFTRDDHSLRDAVELIQSNVKSTRAKYYGGMCFDPDSQIGEEWQSFGKFTFTLPRFELISTGEKTVFAANFLAEGQDAKTVKGHIIKELKQFTELPISTESATAVEIECAPNKDRWLENVSDIIAMFGSGDLKKVVLARKMLLEMPEFINPFRLLSKVCSDQLPTYEFCFQTANDAAFLGSSPECLFRIDGKSIYTEALAGTATVGKTDTQTTELSKELKKSKKDLLEQAYVRDDVLDALADISSGITTDHHPKVVKLRSLQHLITEYTGTLKDAIDIVDVIESLHPTAAVNGLPRDIALNIINASELFSRGLYAGPIGYIGDNVAEFAVAIRSALIQQNKIHLYAGAGIVKDSDPNSEWIETENKLQQFLDILK